MKYLRFILAIIMLVSLTLPAIAQTEEESAPEQETIPVQETFSDVPVNSTFFVPVQFLREKRIIQGYGDGTFRPKETVNRIEALAMILRSAAALPSEELTAVQQFNLPVDTVLNLRFPEETNITIRTPSIETPIELERTGILELILPNGGILRSGRIFLDQTPIFTDVKPTDWFFSLVQRGVSLDIVKGYPDGTFQPAQNSNLAEALAILLRTHRVELRESTGPLPVEDVPENEWFAPAMEYGLNTTIVIPNFQNRVLPDKPMTRGEIASLIYRFLRVKDGIQFGRASWYGDGLSSVQVKSNKEYQEQNLTAAHKELAFGTLVRVRNLRSGKTVDVVINDRGPYLPGRIIDLSRTAFSELSLPETGVIPVELEILSQPL